MSKLVIKEESITTLDNNGVPKEKAIKLIIITLISVLSVGMLVGYLLFWDKPQYESKQDYDLKVAIANTKKYPKSAKMRVELGWIYAQQGKLNDAIREYENAQKLDKRSVSAKLNLAIIYMMKKEYRESEKILVDLVKKNPQFTDARINLGETYMELKEYDKAIKEFDFVLKANPGTVDFMYAIGNAYEKKGDKKTALIWYKEAIRFVPDYQEAKNGLMRLGYKVTKIEDKK